MLECTHCRVTQTAQPLHVSREQHDCSIQQILTDSACLQTFVSRTRLAVQRAEDMTATPFEEDNISVVPSDQGQAPGHILTWIHLT